MRCGYAENAPADAGTFEEREALLRDFTCEPGAFYRFGDNWIHIVRLEKARCARPDGEAPDVRGCRAGAHPKMSDGGSDTSDFLKCFADPSHEEQRNMSAGVAVNSVPSGPIKLATDFAGRH
jgi:hypothetical protein